MSTTANQAHRSWNQRQAIGAAMQNEQITRERVDRLERILGLSDYPPVGGVERWRNVLGVVEGLRADADGMEKRLTLAESMAHGALCDVAPLRRGGFMGRLRWLFTGK